MSAGASSAAKEGPAAPIWPARWPADARSGTLVCLQRRCVPSCCIKHNRLPLQPYLLGGSVATMQTAIQGRFDQENQVVSSVYHHVIRLTKLVQQLYSRRCIRALYLRLWWGWIAEITRCLQSLHGVSAAPESFIMGGHAFAGLKQRAECIAPAELWTLLLGFGLAILVQRAANWLQVTNISGHCTMPKVFAALAIIFCCTEQKQALLVVIALAGRMYFGALHGQGVPGCKQCSSSGNSAIGLQMVTAAAAVAVQSLAWSRGAWLQAVRQHQRSRHMLQRVTAAAALAVQASGHDLKGALRHRVVSKSPIPIMRIPTRVF